MAMELPMEDLEQRLLDHDEFGETATDTFEQRKPANSNRSKVLVVFSVLALVGIVVGCVAATGGFSSHTPAAQTPDEARSYQAVMQSLKHVQQACSVSCSLSIDSLGINSTQGEALGHLNASLGEVKLFRGSWSYSSTTVAAYRRRRAAYNIPVLKYQGTATARNLTFNATVMSWFEPTSKALRLALVLRPDAAARPAWVNSAADVGFVQQLVGDPDASAMPVAVNATTVGYVSHDLQLETAPDLAMIHKDFHETMTQSPGVSVSSMAPASALPGVSDMLLSAGVDPSQVQLPVVGHVQPSLQVTASVPDTTQIKLGHVELKDVQFHVNKTTGPSGVVERFITASAVLLLPGQAPLDLSLAANITGKTSLNLVAAAAAEQLPFGLVNPATKSATGWSLSTAQVTIDINVQSLWACTQHDYTQQCPAGWLAVNSTTCVDPEWLTCANLSLFGSAPPPALYQNPRLADCHNLECDCACLSAQPWPGVNNATADAWRAAGCPNHVPGAPAPHCSGIVTLASGGSSTVALADKEAFYKACPTAPWPCQRDVTVAFAATLDLYGTSSVQVSATLDTADSANDALSLQLDDIKLTSSGSVVLKDGALSLSSTEADVSAQVALAVSGAASPAVLSVDLSANAQNFVLRATAANIPLNAGLAISNADVSVLVARAAPHAVDVDVDGTVAVAGYTFSASADYTTQAGLTSVTLTLDSAQQPSTLEQAVNTLSGSSSTYSAMAMPASTAQLLGGVQLDQLAFVYRNSLPSIEVTAEVTVDGIAAELRLLFVPKAPAAAPAAWSSVNVAAELLFAKDFALTTVVPDATNVEFPASYLRGGLIISTFAPTDNGFPTAWYTALDAVQASPGASLAAAVPIAAFENLGFPKGVWPTTASVTVSASLATGASSNQLSFEVDLPPNGQLAAGVVLQQASLSIHAGLHSSSSSTPAPAATSFAVTGKLAITTHLSGSTPLLVDVTGTLQDRVFSLTGTATSWVLGHGVTMKSLQVTFQAGADTPAHGSIQGLVDIDGATVQGSLNLPSMQASVEVDIPKITLAPGLAFDNVTVTAATAQGVDVHGALVVDVPGNNGAPLVVDTDAKFANGQYTLSASMASWAVGDGLTVEDVKIDVQGALGGKMQSATLAGSLHTDMGTVSVTADLPFSSASGAVTLDFTGWELGSDVTLNQGQLTFKPAGMSFVADADVHAGSTTLTFSGSGDFSHYGGFTFAGSLSGQLPFASGKLLATSVSVNLLVNKTQTPTVTGSISGKVDFAGTTVDMDMTIPLKKGMAEIEVPTLRLDSRVVLHDLTAEFNDEGAQPVITFSGTCDIDAGSAATQPISLTVQGTSTQGSFSFTGTLDAWTVHVGKDAFTFQHLTVQLAKQASGEVSGSITAETQFDSYDLDASLAFPTPSGVQGLVFDLTLKDTAAATAVTPASVVAAGSNAPSAGTVPSNAVGATVMGAHLEALTLQIITAPPMLNVTGTAAIFGSDQLTVTTIIRQVEEQEQQQQVAPAATSAAPTPTPTPTTSGAASDPTSTTVATTAAAPALAWGYSVTVDLTHSFGLSSVVPTASSWFSQFTFAAGGLRLADPPSEPLDDPAYAAAPSVWDNVPASVAEMDNVLLVGELSFQQLSSQMAPAALWSGQAEMLVAWAAFGFDDESDLVLNVTLPDNLPLGSDLTINNGTVQVSSAEPHFDLRTVATLTLGDLSPLVFECDIEDTATAFTITSAYIHNHRLAVGSNGLEATALMFTGEVDKTTSALSGNLTGVVVLADVTFDLVLQFPYVNGMQIELQAHTTVSTTLTLTGMLDALHPGTDLPSWGNVFGTPVFDLRVTIDTSPVAFTVYAYCENLFHIADRLSLKFVFQERRSDWIWAVGVGIGQPFKLSQLSSDWDLLSSLSPIDQGGVIVSSYPQYFQIPGSPQILVVEGVTIFGNFPMDGHLSGVAKATGITSLLVQGSYSFESGRLSLSGTIDTDWHVGNVFYVKNASLFVDLPGTKGMGAFDFGIGANFEVVIGPASTPHNSLALGGDLMVSEVGLALNAQLNTPWVDPFGIHGVTVEDTEVEVGLSFADLVPYLVGVSGGLQIDKTEGEITVFVDAAEPEDFVLAGSLTHFSLASLVESLTFDAIPPKIADEIFDVSFNNLALSINLDPETLIFNHQTFRPGFNFSVQEFQLWFLQGSADIQIDVDVVYVHVALNPFDVAGGVLKVGGMTEAGQDTDEPLALTISIGPHYVQDYFDLSASATFLDVMTVGVFLDISADAGFQFALKYQLEPLFDFFINLTLAGDPSQGEPDFSLYADLGLELPQKVSAAITNFLNSIKNAADQKIQDAQNALNQWQQSNGAKITQLQNQINAQEQQIKSALAQHEQEIQEHLSNLNGYSSTLNNYEQQKQGFEQGKRNCHWYDVGCDAHNAWEDAQIAWVDVKIGFYDAKVAVETAALKALGWVEGAAADVDEALNPVIDAKRVAVAALSALTATEDGLEHALSIAEDGINDVIKGLIDFEGAIFGLKSLIVTADSLQGLSHGEQCTLSVEGTFLGKPYNWQVDFEFPPSFDNMVQSLWTTIKSDLHL